MYFGFSFSFSCQADNYKISAQQQAVNVVRKQDLKYMDPYEMRQLSLQYSFPFKFFELLQFGAEQILESSASFLQVFVRIKKVNLFATSRLYLKPTSGDPSQEEFANYLVELIEESDYYKTNFLNLLDDYQFPAARYNPSNMAPYWKTAPRYIDPKQMHHIIQTALKLHISERAEVYHFSNPFQHEKYGIVRIWEDLQHYVCIDRDRKLIQMITSGFD